MNKHLYILLGLSIAPVQADVVVAYESDNGNIRIEMTDEVCPEHIAKNVVPKKIKAEVGPLFTYKVIVNMKSGIKYYRYDCYGLLYVKRPNDEHVEIPIVSWDGNWMVTFQKGE